MFFQEKKMSAESNKENARCVRVGEHFSLERPACSSTRMTTVLTRLTGGLALVEVARKPLPIDGGRLNIIGDETTLAYTFLACKEGAAEIQFARWSANKPLLYEKVLPYEVGPGEKAGVMDMPGGWSPFAVPDGNAKIVFEQLNEQLGARRGDPQQLRLLLAAYQRINNGVNWLFVTNSIPLQPGVRTVGNVMQVVWVPDDQLVGPSPIGLPEGTGSYGEFLSMQDADEQVKFVLLQIQSIGMRMDFEPLAVAIQAVAGHDRRLIFVGHRKAVVQSPVQVPTLLMVYEPSHGEPRIEQYIDAWQFVK
jgi:hypothetical protein